MKRVALVSIVAAGMLSGYEIDLHRGWQFKGALEDLNATVLFQNPNIKSVWTYDTKNSKWRVYLPNNPTIMQHLPSFVSPLGLIKKEEGYWVNAIGSVRIDTGIQKIVSLLNAYEDTPQDFSLSDIANKTFYIYASYEESVSPRVLYMVGGEGKENVILNFDGNGVAQVGPNEVYRYEKGWVVLDENGTVDTRFKKLAQDSNGIIAVGIYHDSCEDRYMSYLDPWLTTTLQPINMEEKLPYTVYENSSYEYKVYETNHSITYYYYNEETKSYELENVSYRPTTFTIENGAIKTYKHNVINYGEYNTTQETTQTLRIVASVGRYDVVDKTLEWKERCQDSKLIGKSWDDILQNKNISPCVPNLQGSGDQNITPSIDGNKLIVSYHYCYQAGSCGEKCYDYNNTYLLDNQQGVVERYEKDDWISVVSQSPIVKPGRVTYSARKKGRVGGK